MGARIPREVENGRRAKKNLFIKQQWLFITIRVFYKTRRNEGFGDVVKKVVLHFCSVCILIAVLLLEHFFFLNVFKFSQFLNASSQIPVLTYCKLRISILAFYLSGCLLICCIFDFFSLLFLSFSQHAPCPEFAGLFLPVSYENDNKESLNPTNTSSGGGGDCQSVCGPGLEYETYKEGGRYSQFGRCK